MGSYRGVEYSFSSGTEMVPGVTEGVRPRTCGGTRVEDRDGGPSSRLGWSSTTDLAGSPRLRTRTDGGEPTTPPEPTSRDRGSCGIE